VNIRHAGKRSVIAVGTTLMASLLMTSGTYAQTPSSLGCSPAVIAGGSGDSATCTVTLSAAAPAGGTVVTLGSSLIELAASLPSITVPAGQSTAAFTVATNPEYRAYSGLQFDATISATANGTTRNATLTTTAQPRPADFTSGSQAGSNTQWSGLMCGGIAPIGGRQGILYSCSAAQGTGFGTCTFRQECSLGCRRVPPSGSSFNDSCSTSGPNAVALSRNVIVSGDRVPATIVNETPAGQGLDQDVGVPRLIDPNFNSSSFPHNGITFTTGATTVPFSVATSYVPSIQFVDVGGFWYNASIPPFLITNGRAGQRWLVMLPPNPAPAAPIPTLGDFLITGFNPITGGDTTIGQIDMSGLSRTGGPTFTITSSNSAVVPTQTFSAPASSNVFGFQVLIQTQPVSADTDVTITASDGRYRFTGVLTVRATPPPPVLSDVSVSPSSVVGGNSSIGTVTLSAPQSGATVVALSTPAPTTVAQMPSSVTVPAGATSATFTITTFAVTSQFNMNIFAGLAGSPGQQALLLITPGGPTGISRLNINPVDLVGGASSTGTVTLSSPAPSGGAVVTLSKALSNGGPGTVPATVPASVTVPAGQTSASFPIGTSSVTATTNVRISAAFNGSTFAADMTLFPLLSQVLFNGNAPGGTPAPGTVNLGGPAPSGGLVVSLSSANTSLVTVPASVTVPAGQTSVAFTANTQPVTQTTGVVVSASSGSTTVTTTLFLVVSKAVSSVTLNPSTVTGGVSSTATVTLQSAAPNGNAVVSLASSNTILATVPFSVVVPAGQTSTTFTVNTAQVTAVSTVDISASYQNVTKSATLTLNPSGATGPTLSAVSLNPASVVGGNSSTGTVTLSAAAPTGGASVSLSDNSSAATVPASVTIPAGSTSATFAVTSTSVTTSTTATISALWGGVTRTATLSVNSSAPPPPPPPPGQAATLTVSATGRSGERVTSSPTGINVAVGSSGSGSFTTGTSIRLSVSNGRDAIWSGACSSGGNKTRSCTFTITGTASVTANVR
jgi:hypothetical protein